MEMHFVTLCVKQICESMRFRLDFVGFLRPVTYVALCVVSASAVKSAFVYVQ
ncbi:Uncharacterized protein ALO88_05386 [Pseudomonas syringae pv. antirrhini]|uniref:Uncharacterized protein n=1 Tax=Pseudomonas syringae pv. antirrhini TaxID=251702 RepID=A0A0P9J5S4_9PSED|nr:Uncharacterized protein ALO88_05386 [Pseudomonas syringae pv. antirrhini]